MIKPLIMIMVMFTRLPRMNPKTAARMFLRIGFMRLLSPVISE
jgi:hypothetical protein